MKFTYTVVIDTDTVEHADQVMAERLGPDEEYEDEAGVKFDYRFDWPVPAPAIAPNAGYARFLAHFETIAREAGLGSMTEILGIVHDRELVPDTVLAGLTATDVTDLYDQFIAPAIDQIEDDLTARINPAEHAIEQSLRFGYDPEQIKEQA